MTNFSRYLFCLLSALFLFWLTTVVIALTAEPGSAEPVISEKPFSPALVPLSVSRSFVKPGNPQQNSRLSKGKFLIAGRQMKDPRFIETVILLIRYDSDGAVGLVVNLPTTIKISDLLPGIKEQPGKEHFTYVGGPVSINQVFLLFRSHNKPEESQWIFDDVYVSSSSSVLEELIKKPSGEAAFRVYAGYAGWGAGQLEREVLQGAWQISGADADTIFNKPSSEVWKYLNREGDTPYIEI